MFKKADVFLYIIILVAGLALSALPFLSKGGEGETLEVWSDGELYGVYALSEDLELDVSTARGTNHISIKEGQAQITEATCANQTCVHSAAVSRAGESIVCLPNRLSLKVVSEGGEAYVDAVSE